MSLVEYRDIVICGIVIDFMWIKTDLLRVEYVSWVGGIRLT
jgi:hypothetical protein